MICPHAQQQLHSHHQLPLNAVTCFAPFDFCNISYIHAYLRCQKSSLLQIQLVEPSVSFFLSLSSADFSVPYLLCCFSGPFVSTPHVVLTVYNLKIVDKVFAHYLHENCLHVQHLIPYVIFLPVLIMELGSVH